MTTLESNVALSVLSLLAGVSITLPMIVRFVMKAVTTWRQ